MGDFLVPLSPEGDAPEEGVPAPAWTRLGDRLKRGVAHALADRDEVVTPAQLGEVVGRSEGTISLWMNNKSYPNIEQAYLMAQRLKISAAWLVYEQGSMLDGYHEPPKPMPPARKIR